MVEIGFHWKKTKKISNLQRKVGDIMQFATIDDLNLLWRPVKPEEEKKAEELLKVVSSSLIYEAKKVGKDLIKMVDVDENLEQVARSVTCDVVARTLMTSTDSEPLTQFTESAGGYSMSGTYLTPGGGLFIKKSELARLCLRRQRYGAMEVFGDGYEQY